MVSVYLVSSVCKFIFCVFDGDRCLLSVYMGEEIAFSIRLAVLFCHWKHALIVALDRVWVLGGVVYFQYICENAYNFFAPSHHLWQKSLNARLYHRV